MTKMKMPENINDKKMRQEVSLARAISKLGYASRSKAEILVKESRVSVNDKIIKNPNHRISMKFDKIFIDGIQVKTSKKIYIMLNKPRGLITSANDEKGRETVFKCLNGKYEQNLFPVGRLDKASEGLIFFTNDTRWADRITKPESKIKKTYHVQINCQLSENKLNQLKTGIVLEDGTMAKCEEVSLIRVGDKNSWIEVILTEGKNREIRRMLDFFSIEVLRLIRIAIGKVKLGDLKKGDTRPLTDDEIKIF